MGQPCVGKLLGGSLKRKQNRHLRSSSPAARVTQERKAGLKQSRDLCSRIKVKATEETTSR